MTVQDGDCDDTNPAIHPDHAELCDGNDNDCDPATTADGGEDDGDADGHLSCADCDDGDASIGWSAADLDCDGVTDPDVVLGITFLPVEAGTMPMGCDAQLPSYCPYGEAPVHTVELTRDFWLMETELTDAQWDALFPNNPSFDSACGSDCPVEQVTLFETISFANALSTAAGLAPCYQLYGCTGTVGDDLWCTSASVNAPSAGPYQCEGYRLPTEAEWEYAARAGTDTDYAGSDVYEDVAWMDANSGLQKHPVAQLEPNAWGFYDMSGNVFEWTQDGYDDEYYVSSPSVDPLAYASDGIYSLRSGSYNGLSEFARVYARGFQYEWAYLPWLGIRLARTVP